MWYLGYDVPVINGLFDGMLKQEVMSFQKSNGLDVDGICGAATWTALMQIIDPEELRYNV